ncbi:MAG: hypothetical protein Q9210_001488 [Variospora velana]
MVSTDDRNALTVARSERTRLKVRSQLHQRTRSICNAATGASAAGLRAISSYFRIPFKAFFRTRVDYLTFARALSPQIQAKQGWSWRMSTAGLLTYAVRTHGWGFIPNQILPPLLANASVGAVLYMSYLQSLGALHRPSAEPLKRVYPPPPPMKTFAAGAGAGAIQSVIAAPPDVLAVRSRPTDMLDGRYKSMWQSGYLKTKETGFRGIFAGWSLSFDKDSLGYGMFFATFDLQWWNLPKENRVRMIKPHYAIEPSFLMGAGVAASVAQQIIHYPVCLVQDIHYRSLANFDGPKRPRARIVQSLWVYMDTCEETFRECRSRAIHFDGWGPWLYKKIFWNTLRQLPSTSVGLVIFELERRRYGSEAEAATIEKDGYSIILT